MTYQPHQSEDATFNLGARTYNTGAEQSDVAGTEMHSSAGVNTDGDRPDLHPAIAHLRQRQDQIDPMDPNWDNYGTAINVLLFEANASGADSSRGGER